MGCKSTLLPYLIPTRCVLCGYTLHFGALTATRGAARLTAFPRSAWERDKRHPHRRYTFRTVILRSRILPYKVSISKMSSISPSPPLDPYPHPRLCGQAGMTPMNIGMRITSKIVPGDMVMLLLEKNVKLKTIPNGVTLILERFDDICIEHKNADAVMSGIQP